MSQYIGRYQISTSTQITYQNQQFISHNHFKLIIASMNNLSWRQRKHKKMKGKGQNGKNLYRLGTMAHGLYHKSKMNANLEGIQCIINASTCIPMKILIVCQAATNVCLCRLTSSVNLLHSILHVSKNSYVGTGKRFISLSNILPSSWGTSWQKTAMLVASPVARELENAAPITNPSAKLCTASPSNNEG